MTTDASTPSRRPARRQRRRAWRAVEVATGVSTRVEILKSAAVAFRRLGYHGATVEKIAAVLHMKKGNLYYYFQNKEEILFACHQYSLDRLLAQLDEVEQSGIAPDEKLRQLIVFFAHTILDELHGTALFLELEALSPTHLKTVIARRDRFDHGIRHILEEGIRIRAVRPRRCQTAVVCHSRRRELDSAVVQPRWTGDFSGDRRSLRGLSDWRTAEGGMSSFRPDTEGYIIPPRCRASFRCR